VRTAVEAVEGAPSALPTLYQEVLWPLLSHTGQAWQGGQVRIWEEALRQRRGAHHREMLYPSVLKVKATVPASGRSVLLACRGGGSRPRAALWSPTASTWPVGPRTTWRRHTPNSRRCPRRLGVDAVVNQLIQRTFIGSRYVTTSIRSRRSWDNVQVWVADPPSRHSHAGLVVGRPARFEELLGEARSVQRGLMSMLSLHDRAALPAQEPRSSRSSSWPDWPWASASRCSSAR